jgi:SAM-dependent methyltransferase
MEQPAVWGGFADDPDQVAKLRHFRQMLPEGARTLLDVGCGDGALTNALAEDFEVTGVDLSEAALAHVRTTSVVASATDLPFGEDSFDVVLSSQVLEHLEDADYRRALSEMRRVARTHVLISVPYREDLGVRTLRCPRCGDRHHVWGHLRRFTIDSLARDAGVPPVDVRVFGDLQDPPWPAPLLRLRHLANDYYVPAGQSPMCPRCGNTDYTGLRRLPVPGVGTVKAWVDRRRGAPRLPFWLAVLFELPRG